MAEYLHPGVWIEESQEEPSSEPAAILVLGLGNEILKDDAVGIRVAEKLRGCFTSEVEVRSTSLFGLSLLDELIGREKVLLIDSYIPEDSKCPDFREITLDSLGNSQAVCPHFVGLAEIREVMRSLDLGFPLEVRILGIPVSDPLTFSIEMSSEVAARLDEAVERGRRIVMSWLPIADKRLDDNAAKSVTSSGRQVPRPHLATKSQ